MTMYFKKIVYLFFVMMFLFGLFIANTSWAEIRDEVLKEAKELERIEKEYFNKRMQNDLKGTYQFQHPDFKKAISIEEFMYFEGDLVSGYRNESMGHISGGMIPPVNWIKKNFTKKDMLGFPRKHRYKWFSNPFRKVKGYNLEKISISKDGKFAIVNIILTGRERINPALVREDISFDFKRPYVDYWEKVDGKWVITVLAHSSSVSGGESVYFIPNNNDAWEKKDYIHIDTESLLAMPDADRHAVK